MFVFENHVDLKIQLICQEENRKTTLELSKQGNPIREYQSTFPMSIVSTTTVSSFNGSRRFWSSGFLTQLEDFVGVSASTESLPLLQ
jgi:hypothetical protein